MCKSWYLDQRIFRGRFLSLQKKIFADDCLWNWNCCTTANQISVFPFVPMPRDVYSSQWVRSLLTTLSIRYAAWHFVSETDVYFLQRFESLLTALSVDSTAVTFVPGAVALRDFIHGPCGLEFFLCCHYSCVIRLRIHARAASRHWKK